MAVFSVERYGFVSIYDLVSSIGQDLTSHGFRAVKDSVSGALVDAVLESVTTEIVNDFGGQTYSAYGVSAVTLVNAGTKYDPANPPTITFSAPTRTEAEVMGSNGWTIGSYITGSGSTATTWIKGSINAQFGLTRGNIIKTATGTVTVGTNGTITGITITNPGFGYGASDVVTVTITNTNRKTTTELLLESTEMVDPLGTKVDSNGVPLTANLQVHGTGINSVPAQPWRIYFDLRNVATPAITSGALGIYLGTAATLRDDGVIAYTVAVPNSTTATKVEPAGNTGKQWSGSAGAPTSSSMDECFLNRSGRSDPQVAAAYPMSYRLTITNRGIFLGIWEANAEESGVGFNWLLVQRSVDRLTGETRGSTNDTRTGRCPVYCLNSVNNKYWKFVVRERDLIMPSQRKQADANVEDSSAVINSKNQQSLTETGEYVITFISNLNSARYKYSDELDIIGTVSADVVGAGTAIDVTVYGEAQPRTYRALYPNGAYGTGMRLMVLESNPNET